MGPGRGRFQNTRPQRMDSYFPHSQYYDQARQEQLEARDSALTAALDNVFGNGTGPPLNPQPIQVQQSQQDHQPLAPVHHNVQEQPAQHFMQQVQQQAQAGTQSGAQGGTQDQVNRGNSGGVYIVIADTNKPDGEETTLATAEEVVNTQVDQVEASHAGYGSNDCPCLDMRQGNYQVHPSDDQLRPEAQKVWRTVMPTVSQY